MAIDVTQSRGRTLVLDGLAQSDIDMDNHKLLNLDTSNLPPVGGVTPPTIHPPANQWLHDWNIGTMTWTATQPGFEHLAGNLTSSQQQAITRLGTITAGIWQGTVIAPLYLPTLDLIRSPVADLSMANRRITNLAAPTAPQDAVNMEFMDLLLQGLNPKEAVKVATTAHSARIGLPVIDGIQLAEGDRVLVKNQGAARLYENGIFIASAIPGIWSRSSDCDDAVGLTHAYCVVREGNENGGTSWVQINTVDDPIGSDDLIEFVVFSTVLGSGLPGPPGPPGVGVPTGGTTAQVLAKIDDAPFNTHWVDPGAAANVTYATLQTTPTASISVPHVAGDAGRMVGLAGYITPITTGKVVAVISGYFWNDSAGGQVSARMCIGSGTAPLHGVPQPTGTSVLLGNIAAAFEGGITHSVPFSVSCVVTTLTAGIQFWYDLFLVANTTGNAVVSGVSITLHEIP